MKKIYLTAILSVFYTLNVHALDLENTLNANITKARDMTCEHILGPCDVTIRCATKTISCSARGTRSMCEVCDDGIINGEVSCLSSSGEFQYETCDD